MDELRHPEPALHEETYKRLLAEHTKDDGVRFEETGIDYLFVDEAHAYKNRRVDSSIDGAANSGSQRAQDLDAKLWALRSNHGPRVATFATATPVANSMAELWVMQTYLQPDHLEAVGLKPFDAWAATFGRTHTALELAPDGARVLDLMSSWVSHLPPERAYAKVVGQGMNPDELDANPRLTESFVQDLNADPRLRVVRQEQFGPVLPIMAFDNEDEVIAAANDSEFGLCSSVWTPDRDRAVKIARQLEAQLAQVA